MVAKVHYRRAVETDIVVLARHHRAMFEEMRSPATLCLADNCCAPGKDVQAGVDFDALEQSHKQKLAEQLPDGTCVAWVAEHEGMVVASGGVSMIKTTPVPEDPSYTIGFIHSIYTDRAWRRKGIAATIVDRLLEYCAGIGISRVQLGASEAGKKLYAEKGFSPLANVMIRWL